MAEATRPSPCGKRPREELTTDPAAPTHPVPVVFDHDGGVDDLVALALLLANPAKVRLIGCIVLDADCYVKDAVSASGKLAALVQRRAGGNRIPGFPILPSSLSGVHPFPHDWRVDAKKMDDLPSLNIPQFRDGWETAFPGPPDGVTGEEAMAQLVMQHPEPVTICVTGPLTNVAYCVTKYGVAFADKVREVVVMGGSIDVDGNVFVEGPGVDEPGVLPAEWNIYWDAPSAKVVVEAPCMAGKVKLFSLDATNHVPVTSALVQEFGRYNDSILAQFIGASWAMCTHLELGGYGKGYYAWDVLTAAHIIDPAVATFEEVPIAVDAVLGARSEGRTRRDPTSVHKVLVAKTIDKERFYKMVFAASQFA